jgi:uncharacterized damage-inducible protein DinB
MKDFFKQLFAYNHHVNQKLGDVYIGYPHKISERAIKLYSHIINAHHIWNHRIIAEQATFGVWQEQPVSAFHSIDSLNNEDSLQILEGYDLNLSINYTNTSGLTFNNSIGDTLFHIINHSTYHRAQIAIEFKLNGIDPLLTDYIVYKR